MPKILFVSDSADFSRFNKPYMKWCSVRGWQVDYCCNDGQQIECDSFFPLNIPRNVLTKDIFKTVKTLRDILEREQYDVIHCHTFMGGFVARCAARKLYKKGHVKIIYTAHGFDFCKRSSIGFSLFKKIVEKNLSRVTDVLVTVNKEDYKYASKKLRAKKTILMNGVGVDLKKFSPCKNESERNELRAKKGFLPEDFIILYPASFIARKNHKQIFDILPKLNKDIPNLKVVLLGDGELLEHYKNYVEKNAIEELVTFTGNSDEVATWCKLCDLFLMPSLQEGLPLAMVEALASGMPIVASKIRGNVDVVQSEKNGILCPLGENQPFIDAVEKMYADPDLRAHISAENVLAAKKFSVKLTVDQIAEEYRELTGL